MNPILTIICTSWLLGVAVNAYEKALVFQRHERVVIDLPNKSRRATEKCGAWATACPLSKTSEAGQNFLEKYSITGKALLAVDMYEDSNQTTEVNDEICDTLFEMSALFYINNLSVEFGYEVFREAGQDDKYDLCKYEDYQSIAIAAKTLRIDGVKNTATNWAKFIKKNLSDRARSTFTLNGGRMIYNGSVDMKLLWLPMFKMKYSFTNMKLETVTYEIRRNSRWPIKHEQCEDYKLGLDSYIINDNEKVDVDKLYNDQINIFEDFKLPPPKSCAPDDEACTLNQVCNSDNKCLEKWSLVPLDQFHLFHNTPLHCSYMTTVPIWTGIAKSLLEKLDQYLYALFRMREVPLHIIAGVTDDLKLPLKEKPKKSRTVYLDKAKRRIPAPSAVFKIVKYILPSCKSEPKEKSKSKDHITVCEYSIIFIINNDPNFDPNIDSNIDPKKGTKKGTKKNTKKNTKKRFCEENKDLITEWGWDTLLPQNEQDRKNIYVCPDNDATLHEIYGKVNLDKPKTAPGDLNLKKFPFLVGDNKIELRNIKKTLDKKYDELLARGDGPFNYSGIAYLSGGGFNDVEDEYLSEYVEKDADKTDDETDGSGDEKV